MITLKKTNSNDDDFILLVKLLDEELEIRDGDDHAFYDQFNKIDLIKYAIVLYKDDQPIGCGAIKHFDEGAMEVKRMYVKLSHRGQGHASSILRALEAWAQSLKSTKCFLETGINQPEAISLYKKSGYTQIPNYGQYHGIETSLCFEKVLE